MAETYANAGAFGLLAIYLFLGATAFGLVALGLCALTRAFRLGLVLAGVAVGFGFVSVLGGFVGRTSDLRGSYKAVAHASPYDRLDILEGSKREAQANVTMGLLGLPGLLLGSLGVALAFGRTQVKR